MRPNSNKYILILERIALVVIILFAMVYLPWWATLLLILTGITFIPSFYEGILLAYFYDSYAIPPDFLFGFPITIISIIGVFLIMWAKRTLII